MTNDYITKLPFFSLSYLVSRDMMNRKANKDQNNKDFIQIRVFYEKI